MPPKKRRTRAKFHDEEEVDNNTGTPTQTAKGSSAGGTQAQTHISNPDIVHTEEYHRLPSKRMKVTRTDVQVDSPHSESAQLDTAASKSSETNLPASRTPESNNQQTDESPDNVPASAQTPSGAHSAPGAGVAPSVKSPKETEEPKRKQGASIEMEAFEKEFPRLLAHMLAREAPMDDSSQLKCPCGDADSGALYRCQECFIDRLCCAKCITRSHQDHPLHWIEHWTGDHFEKQMLSDIGFIIYLGHNGNKCHHTPRGEVPLPFTIVHHNGIHNSRIGWCFCAGGGNHVDQLMLAGLFPATVIDPRTAFSFSMLREYTVHKLQSKKAAYDYFTSLRRLTNGAFTYDTPDRYREFLRVARIWQHLIHLKRAGDPYNLQDGLPHVPKGCLAITCFACLQEGFNSLDREEDDPDYIDWVLVGADGNFHLIRKVKVSDPDDVGLNKGRMMFVLDALLRIFSQKVDLSMGKEDVTPATCSGFKAGDMRRQVKMKGVAVSGVVGISCIRHGFFRPQGMVDLFKGERYSHVDFALLSALRPTPKAKKVVSYDVACQYNVNFIRRVMKWFSDDIDWAMEILFRVPMMHILGHKDDCQYRFALQYTRGVGLAHGETVEHPWAEGNQTGGSTKEMNAGHRHDSLDAFHNFWNWSKLQKLADYLCGRLVDVIYARDRLITDFENMCKNIPQHQISEWSSMNTDAKLENGLWTSVYRHRAGPLPSREAVLKDLAKREIESNQAPVTGIDGEVNTSSTQSTFVDDGVSIWLLQLQLQEKATMLTKPPITFTDTDKARLAKSVDVLRASLKERTTKWRVEQERFMPDVDTDFSRNDTGEADNASLDLLGLPSDFNEDDRSLFTLVDLASIEYKILEGRAHDCLQEVRERIKHKKAFLQTKDEDIRGGGANTRAQELLRKVETITRSHAITYNSIRDKLLKLGLDPKDGSLQYLSVKDDLWMYSFNTSRTRGNKPEPWYWSITPPQGSSQKDLDDWSVEVDRVRWFRLRANRDRHIEEVNILKADLKRTIKSHRKFVELWRNAVSDSASSREERGRNSYAVQTAVMHERMAAYATEMFRIALDGTGENP